MRTPNGETTKRGNPGSVHESAVALAGRVAGWVRRKGPAILGLGVERAGGVVGHHTESSRDHVVAVTNPCASADLAG